ncbi:MAG: TetR/AcrR family transcriptional regulator [Elusimicrobiota bacterium]
MAPTTRLSGDERRTAIVEAVLPLFAKKGFHGVTTRELAEAAGVSEALLFRHFPSKEFLYKEVRDQGGNVHESASLFNRLRDIPPSTEKLVLLTRLLLRRIMTRGDATFPRLLLNSLLEDGHLARTSLKSYMSRWLGPFTQALDAAREAGDLEDIGGHDGLGLWFSHHLAMALVFMGLPGKSAVDYGTAHEALVEQAARFCLRGLGLKEEAIRNCGDPAKAAAVEYEASSSDW